MPEGVVEWFSLEWGYGFIAPDEGGRDLFFQHSQIQASGPEGVTEGRRVRFEVEETERGPQTVNVTPL